MGVGEGIIGLLVIYLISRVAHFINSTKNKLNEIDKKLDEIKADVSNRQ